MWRIRRVSALLLSLAFLASLLPPEWWGSEQKALRKFGVIPPDFRVKEALIVFSTWRFPWKANDFAVAYQELLLAQ